MYPKIQTFTTPDGVTYQQYVIGRSVHIAAVSCDVEALERLGTQLERRGFDVMILPHLKQFNLDGEKAR